MPSLCPQKGEGGRDKAGRWKERGEGASFSSSGFFNVSSSSPPSPLLAPRFPLPPPILDRQKAPPSGGEGGRRRKQKHLGGARKGSLNSWQGLSPPPRPPGQCKKVGPNWTLDGDAQIDPRPFPRPYCSKAKTECTASVSNSSFPSCEVPPRSAPS